MRSEVSINILILFCFVALVTGWIFGVKQGFRAGVNRAFDELDSIIAKKAGKTHEER